MKKQILSYVLVSFVTIFSLTGCFGDSESNECNSGSNLFIGVWYGWSSYPNFYETWIFYENNSIKIDNLFSIEWGTYNVKGNELVITTTMVGFENEDFDKNWIYTFSEDDLHLSLVNKFWEGNTAEFFKEGYRGEYYQKVSDFIGKWSNQTSYISYGDCGDWVRYYNYTFNYNFTVKGEYNWCSSGNNTWHSYLFDFHLDEDNKLCVGSGCSNYTFLEDKNVLDYQGSRYYKVE